MVQGEVGGDFLAPQEGSPQPREQPLRGGMPGQAPGHAVQVAPGRLACCHERLHGVVDSGFLGHVSIKLGLTAHRQIVSLDTKSKQCQLQRQCANTEELEDEHQKQLEVESYVCQMM